jgi:hypothetical protein
MKILVTHQESTQDWKKTASYTGVRTDEESTEKTKMYLKALGPSQTIHY